MLAISQPTAKRLSGRNTPPPRETRLERLQANGQQPAMPPQPRAAHMLGWLFDAGPTQSGAMGDAPLGHAELAAWQANSGVVLQAWQASCLRRLSGEYLAQRQQAEQPDCPPPWLEFQPAARAAVADKLRNAFGSRARGHQPGRAAH